ncbi:unnamed protein product [Protopolystoma xenopodis]|uniref:Uncharacterized protein n=1 Tax=Protopolystoma xenopodis TaxID=117903 RepID=A0A448WAS4_9PLAT|nr:unnamed protein product [Protopolystoma xenopodis]
MGTPILCPDSYLLKFFFFLCSTSKICLHHASIIDEKRVLQTTVTNAYLWIICVAGFVGSSVMLNTCLQTHKIHIFCAHDSSVSQQSHLSNEFMPICSPLDSSGLASLPPDYYYYHHQHYHQHQQHQQPHNQSQPYHQSSVSLAGAPPGLAGPHRSSLPPTGVKLESTGRVRPNASGYLMPTEASPGQMMPNMGSNFTITTSNCASSAPVSSTSSCTTTSNLPVGSSYSSSAASGATQHLTSVSLTNLARLSQLSGCNEVPFYPTTSSSSSSSSSSYSSSPSNPLVASVPHSVRVSSPPLGSSQSISSASVSCSSSGPPLPMATVAPTSTAMFAQMPNLSASGTGFLGPFPGPAQPPTYIQSPLTASHFQPAPHHHLSLHTQPPPPVYPTGQMLPHPSLHTHPHAYPHSHSHHSHPYTHSHLHPAYSTVYQAPYPSHQLYQHNGQTTSQQMPVIHSAIPSPNGSTLGLSGPPRSGQAPLASGHGGPEVGEPGMISGQPHQQPHQQSRPQSQPQPQPQSTSSHYHHNHQPPHSQHHLGPGSMGPAPGSQVYHAPGGHLSQAPNHLHSGLPMASTQGPPLPPPPPQTSLGMPMPQTIQVRAFTYFVSNASYEI